MTAGARANKHEAAVLDGAVRDITEIRRDYDFPVFARAASPGTSLGRYKTVAMNEPALIGGITVHPGDIIVGDLDGVVVVPHAQAAEVLAMAREIDQRELEQAKLIVASGSRRGGSRGSGSAGRGCGPIGPGWGPVCIRSRAGAGPR